MKVAFLKGTGFIDYIIKIWTFGKYSHSELVFSDGTWFSTELAWPFKTSFHRYDEQWANKHFDFIDINITAEQEQRIREFCVGEVGCAYDWKGIILSMILPFKKADAEKWFCSEICVAALQIIGLLQGVKPQCVFPNKLSKLLKK